MDVRRDGDTGIMSRYDCDICDEYHAKDLADLRRYKESSEACNHILERQLIEIATKDTRIAELEAIVNRYPIPGEPYAVDILNYVKSLEGLALSVCLEAGWSLEEARAELEKIRCH